MAHEIFGCSTASGHWKRIGTLAQSSDHHTTMALPVTHHLNLSIFSNPVELDLLIQSVVQSLLCGCVNTGSLICSAFISCKRSSSEVCALCICTAYSWQVSNTMQMDFSIKKKYLKSFHTETQNHLHSDMVMQRAFANSSCSKVQTLAINQAICCMKACLHKINKDSEAMHSHTHIHEQP